VTDTPRVAVHSINHFALQLPDLAEADRFVTAFGLAAEAAADELKLRTIAGDHVWTRLFRGPAKGLAYLSLGCAEADLPAVRRRAFEAGAVAATPHPRGDTNGFWFTDPDGNLVQVKPAGSTQPASKSALPDENVPAGVRGVLGSQRAERVRPTRLSHILLFTPDVGRMVAFYSEGLGLNLSDRSRDIIAFMHAPHGCDHHLLAFAKSPAKGFHHSAWDVPGIGDVGRGAMQMRQAGYAEHWGVGRHVLGSNYFNYVRDRAGAWWEHSCHIDYVPAGVRWPAADHPPEDSLYLWGADVPANFVENTEAQTHPNMEQAS